MVYVSLLLVTLLLAGTASMAVQAHRRSLHDQQALRRLKAELSESRSKYENLLHHMDAAIHTYANPAGLTVFRASSMNDLVGQSVCDFIHSDFRDRASARLADVYEAKKISSLVEPTIQCLDGESVDVEVIAASIPYKGKCAGVTLFRDITKRKQTKADRMLAEKFIRSSEERYSRLQKSVDGLSHDLFGVMKASEIEERLIKEVRDVIMAKHIGLIEIDRNKHVVYKCGSQPVPKPLLDEMLACETLPSCDIMESPHGCFIKIGQIGKACSILYIADKSPSLEIESIRVWLKTIARYVSVLFDNFRVIEDLTQELEETASSSHAAGAPPWLLRLLFALSENERKRLSQDLHDSVLQEQIVWYRKLDELATDSSVPQEIKNRLQDVSQGLLDVIYQLRIMCNELRPPLLKEQGIVSSLEALFEFTQLRANVSIQFDASGFHHTLKDDLVTGLYRIVQELLANAAKHSNATEVHFRLFSESDRIRLFYEDNGIGMDVSGIEDSFERMGIYGMKERVRSMEGRIEFQSPPNDGLRVFITVPVDS